MNRSTSVRRFYVTLWWCCRGLVLFFPTGNFSWAEFEGSGHCSRTSGNPVRAATTAKLVDIKKRRTKGSQASTDQRYSMSTHQLYGTRAVGLVYHRFVANAKTICATHEHIFQTRKSQTEMSSLLPSPSISRRAPGYSCLPHQDSPGPAEARWAALPLSSAELRTQHYSEVVFSNKEFKLILHILSFYRGSCSVCGHCSWTSGDSRLCENCNFSLKKQVFHTTTVQLRKCKLSDALTPDFSLSKHAE